MTVAALRVASDQVAAKVIDGEAVIIDFRSGFYFSLEGSAGDLWRAVEDGVALSAVVERLAARYGLDRATVAADVEVLASRLVEEGLCVLAEPGSAPLAEVAEMAGAYATPRLVRYGDLAEHFAIDPPLPELDGLR